MAEEITVTHGKRYKAEIHLLGMEAMASNVKIADMMEEYGFTEVEVSGDGDIRNVAGDWTGNTMPMPATLERYIFNLEEVLETPKKVALPTEEPPIIENEGGE